MFLGDGNIIFVHVRSDVHSFFGTSGPEITTVVPDRNYKLLKTNDLQ